MILLEIILAMLVIAVATLSSASMTLSSSNLNKANISAADATDVMRQLVEELESHSFEEIYARFNADPTDDPDGEATARGSQFTLQPSHRTAFLDTGVVVPTGAVPGSVRSLPYDVDIEFPEDVNGILSEGIVAPTWGLQSWDINGDGTATTGDRRSDYKLLPVSIRLTWTDTEGIHDLQVVRLLTERRR